MYSGQDGGRHFSPSIGVPSRSMFLLCNRHFGQVVANEKSSGTSINIRTLKATNFLSDSLGDIPSPPIAGVKDYIYVRKHQLQLIMPTTNPNQSNQETFTNLVTSCEFGDLEDLMVEATTTALAPDVLPNMVGIFSPGKTNKSFVTNFVGLCI